MKPLHTDSSRYGYSFELENKLKIFYRWIKPQSDILDIGCRDGTLTKKFKPYAVKLIGIDVDPNAVLVARKDGINALEVDANITPLPFDNSSFDVVLINETLEHLVYPEGIFSEVYRILKPDGIIIGSVPNSIVTGKHRMNYYQMVVG